MRITVAELNSMYTHTVLLTLDIEKTIYTVSYGLHIVLIKDRLEAVDLFQSHCIHALACTEVA